jgi:hypothetical protein
VGAGLAGEEPRHVHARDLGGAGGHDRGGVAGSGRRLVLAVGQAESAWLGQMRELGTKREGLINARESYDLKKLGYRLGVGVGADPLNRFAEMNLLDRAFGRKVTGLETEMASMGLNFSGAKQRALRDAKFDRDEGAYGIGNASQDGTNEITRAAEDARLENSRSLADAAEADRERFLNTIRSLGGTS